MKGATAGGDACKSDRDAAVRLYLTEWEKIAFAVVIHDLNAAALAATAADGPGALTSYARALGFIQSFGGLPQDKRQNTDGADRCHSGCHRRRVSVEARQCTLDQRAQIERCDDASRFTRAFRASRCSLSRPRSRLVPVPRALQR